MHKILTSIGIALILSTPAFAGGASEPEEPEVVIAPNKVVEIHYEGKLSDGSVFDSSADQEPLEFVFGVGMLIPGLEQGLEGLAVGETATIEVKAEDAYGLREDQAVHEIPRQEIDPEIQLEEGMQLVGQSPQGPMIVTVVEFDDQTVTIDFNHPLAGEDLTFNIEVVSVQDVSEEELDEMLGPRSGGQPIPTE